MNSIPSRASESRAGVFCLAPLAPVALDVADAEIVCHHVHDVRPASFESYRAYKHVSE